MSSINESHVIVGLFFGSYKIITYICIEQLNLIKMEVKPIYAYLVIFLCLYVFAGQIASDYVTNVALAKFLDVSSIVTFIGLLAGGAYWFFSDGKKSS